ncbi:MAG: 4,5-DOPA dioxygenase extradiol [Geobacter sp.]
MNTLMPTIFIGHGNPMITLSKNVYTEAWKRIGELIPRPKAILTVSAHWYIKGSAVTINPAPSTIHDFGGFTQELHEVQYPAPGCPELARRVKDLLSPTDIELNNDWGLDHGTWTVLRHVYPKADIPVVQLSIDKTKPANYHFELAKRLISLREEGVLVVGSGNIVHSLRAYVWGNNAPQPYDWAVRFDKLIRQLILSGDNDKIIAYEKLGEDAMLSVPTPDHFLPLLYTLGLRKENESISFPVEGYDGGSMSMLAVQIG